MDKVAEKTTLEAWNAGVHTCPYCDGNDVYENDDSGFENEYDYSGYDCEGCGKRFRIYSVVKYVRIEDDLR